MAIEVAQSPFPGAYTLDYRHCQPPFVALLDGVGSWGTGVEVAAWMTSALSERWRTERPRSPDLFADAIAATAASIPKQFQDGRFGDAISVFALFLVEATTTLPPPPVTLALLQLSPKADACTSF